MIRCGNANGAAVDRPSARVRLGDSCSSPLFQLRYAAGAWSDWTPMTWMSRFTALAAVAAPAAPEPPPIGTRMVSTSGCSRSTSRVWVPTPEISSGSSPEWM